ALPLSLNAAGLGRINVLSALGQPLNAEIEVQANSDEISSMTAKMASPTVFQQANVPYAPVISLIRVAVEPRGGTAVLKLSSDRPVSEPFVDMVVELNWAAGKLIREYTFLLDPAVAPSKAVSAVATPEVPAAAQAPAAARAPAQSARPAAPAQPRAAAPSDSYQVQRGDTLSKIANANKPQGVSLEQMLVALLRRNPEAFDGNNINRLKAGRILSIPSAGDAGAITPQEARREVVAQAADFNAYRSRLAETVRTQAPTDAGEAQQQSSGRIAPRVTEAPKPGDDARDQVRVSRTEMKGVEAAAGSNQDRLRMLEEDLAARDRALDDANERLAELERNIAELQKLVELKSGSMAAAQASAEQATAPAAQAPVVPAPAPAVKPPAAEPPAPAAKDAAPPPVPAPSVPVAASPAPAPSEPAPAPAEPPKAVEPPPPPPPPPAPVSAPAPAPLPEPVSTSFADELFGNPTLLMGAGAAILALIGGLAYASRRRKTNEAVSQLAMGAPSELSMGGGSVFGTSGGQSVDTGSSVIQTDFSQSGMSAIDADEGVDPVAEADVYMAYGRDAQAEEILLDALKADPSRTAVHLKLLEIYAQRNSTAQFEATASELYSRTGGQGADWARAAEMGRGIDPDNPLYSATGGQAAAAAAAVAAAAVGESIKPTVAKVPAVEATPPSQDEMSALDFGLPSESNEIKGSASQLKDTWAMPGELSQFGESAESASDSGGISQSATSALDFNLDLGDAPEEAEAPRAEVPSFKLDMAPPTEGGGMPAVAASDDTVELPSLDLPDESSDSTIIAPVQEAQDEDLVLADASETTLEFDLDFAEDEGPTATAAPQPAYQSGTDTTVAIVPESAEAAAGGEPEDVTISLADSALDFDIDALDTPVDDLAVPVELGSVEATDAVSDVGASLDFSTDLDGGTTPSTGSGGAIDTSTIGDDDIDLSATVSNPVPDEEMATDLEQSSFDGTLLDFDFDLEKPADDSAMPDMDATALDISAINLDLEAQEQDGGNATLAIEGSEEDLPTALIPPADAAPAEEAVADSADEAPGDPEVDTKLELARAYEEMGDKDGARELLEEVLAEGSTKQQEQARVVMSRL
ncbi:MAG: LysM peptidoglycan-binding domain-containing protein, partial [Rhodocyclaceae bacterium]|nr:LysM peptidoglycan-binding domain-containing protein [Rhodocyclaceae bacterium]